jgi:hypothetical protein
MIHRCNRESFACSMMVLRVLKPRLTHPADHLLLRRHRNRAELQGGLVDCADHLSSFRGYRGNSLRVNSSWLSVFTLTAEHHDD